MNNFEGLTHIGLYASGLEKSKSFYIEYPNFKLEIKDAVTPE